MDVIDAAAKGDLAVVLAIGLVALAGAVTFLFRTVVKVYQERVARAESLTDRMVETFDGLEEATKTAVAVARDSLDELKRKR